MGRHKRDVGRNVFLRYIVTNLLVLLPPFLVAVAYFAVTTEALSRAADAVAEVQLEGSVSYVDRKLMDLEKIVSQLVVDYQVNRYMNSDVGMDPVELYNKKMIADRLSTIALGGEFLSRCMLYLRLSDRIIYESGFADYSSFYGTLLEVEGYDADAWRRFMMEGESGRFNQYINFQASTTSGGRFGTTHFLIWPIGFKDQSRGSFVAMVDMLELSRRLSKLPDLYGGSIVVFSEDGTLLGASPPDPDTGLISAAAAAASAEGPGVIRIGPERYRFYRQDSSFNNWRYVALMNESRITASAQRIRTMAFLLLGAGFFVALLLSYGVASSNSKPIARLISLVLPQQDMGDIQVSGTYARVEEAIMNLADSKRQLEHEMDSIHGIAKAYFFHNLLRGEYRDRLLFAEDRTRFGVLASTGPYYVIEGRLPSLTAALGGPDQVALSEMLRKAFSVGLDSDEFDLNLSSGAIVAIKRPLSSEAYRESAELYIQGVLNTLTPAVRDGLVFGVGSPVLDPFLLALSYGEAEVAAASSNPNLRARVRFYEDLPAPADAYRYPLELESAVSKAVLSANTVLLDSLINLIFTENFIDRTLTLQESRYLVAAFRGTALRLMGEFSQTDLQVHETLRDLGLMESQPQEDFKVVAKVLTRMAEEKQQGKRSHNECLAAEVRGYVDSKFRDFNLSLSSIAEYFSLSENYLSSFFKEQTGERLSEYLQRKRMTEASSLLKGGKDSVDIIASRCGYANGSSFRRAFKRVYGLSPSEYRDRNGRIFKE